MKVACSSQSFNRLFLAGTLSMEGFLDLAREMGAQGVELEDKHIPDTTPESLTAIRKMATDRGLAVVNIAYGNNFGVADSAALEEQVRKAATWMAHGKALGSPSFRCFAGWPERPDPALWTAMTGALRAACQAAAGLGLTVVTENHNHGGFLATGRDVLRLFAEVHEPNLRLLLDTGNYTDGFASIEATAHLTGHVHAKVGRVMADGADEYRVHNRAIPLLRRLGYDGWLSLEYEGEQDELEVVPHAVRYLRLLAEA